MVARDPVADARGRRRPGTRPVRATPAPHLIVVVRGTAPSSAIRFKVNLERAGTIFDASAPAEAPLRDNVTLHNVAIKQADKTFVLENVEELKLENVTIGTQTVTGRLEWKQTAGEKSAQ